MFGGLLDWKKLDVGQTYSIQRSHAIFLQSHGVRTKQQRHPQMSCTRSTLLERLSRPMVSQGRSKPSVSPQSQIPAKYPYCGGRPHDLQPMGSAPIWYMGDQLELGCRCAYFRPPRNCTVDPLRPAASRSIERGSAPPLPPLSLSTPHSGYLANTNIRTKSWLRRWRQGG